MSEERVTLALDMPAMQAGIDFDMEAVRDYVKSVVAPYASLVVTDENVKEMEAAKRELASCRTRLDKFRKAVKSRYLEPLSAFESEIFQIGVLITDEEENLKGQLAKYEDARVERCREEARKHLEQIARDRGLREEYWGQLAVPQQALARGAWTSKGRISQAGMQRLDAAVSEAMALQQQDDERARREEMNRQQVGILCEALSEKYSLATELSPGDFDLLVTTCTPQELAERMESAARERAEVELRAREMERLAEQARQDAEREAEERRQREEAARAAEAQTPPQEDPPPADVPAPASGNCTVVLTLRDVPPPVVEKLRASGKLLGCSYTMQVMQYGA